MKIVVNRDYGGFGLSRQAQEEIHKIGCPHQKVINRKEYFKNGINTTKELQDNSLKLYGIVQIGDKKILIDNHDRYENRTCPVLISVVEKLKEKANGLYAKLEVVEIPDGVEYDIEDYDGVETIHEKHRSW